MYWLVYMICMHLGCVQVHTHPSYKVLEACVEASVRLEDSTYRSAIDALLEAHIPVEGPIQVSYTCLIKI